MVIRGYRYFVGEWCPTDDPQWHQFRQMDWRDNLEDAQKIIDVLNATDIMFTTYGIILEPVWGEDLGEAAIKVPASGV